MCTVTQVWYNKLVRTIMYIRTMFAIRDYSQASDDATLRDGCAAISAIAEYARRRLLHTVRMYYVLSTYLGTRIFNFTRLLLLPPVSLSGPSRPHSPIAQYPHIVQ